MLLKKKSCISLFLILSVTFVAGCTVLNDGIEIVDKNAQVQSPEETTAPVSLEDQAVVRCHHTEKRDPIRSIYIDEDKSKNKCTIRIEGHIEPWEIETRSHEIHCENKDRIVESEKNLLLIILNRILGVGNVTCVDNVF